MVKSNIRMEKLGDLSHYGCWNQMGWLEYSDHLVLPTEPWRAGVGAGFWNDLSISFYNC